MMDDPSILPSGIRYDTLKVQTSPDDSMSRVMAEVDEYERKIREHLSFDGTFLKDYVRVSPPVLISGFMWKSKADDAAFDVNRKQLIECFFTRC